MPPHHSGTMLHEVYGPTNAAAYIDIAGRQSHTSRQREVNPPQHAPAPAPPYAYGPRHDARVMPPPHQLPPNTSSASADSAELFRKLPESLKRIGTSESSWILTEDCCRVIGDGAAEVGFRHVLTPAENVTVHGVRGILRKKLNVHVSVHTRFSADPGEKKSSKCVVYSGDGMLIEREILSDYKCESIICKCRVKIARVNCNGISGILGYQSVDPATSHIYEHDKQAHKLFPHQELAQGLRTLSNGASKSKFSPYNLSVEQKEFITDYGLASCSTSQMKDAVSTMTYMARMNEISCTPEQLMSATKFLDAVKNWIKNKKRANDFFFLNQWGKCSMSGQDLKEVLDLLMTSPNDRTSPPDMSAYHNLHLLTPEFRETVWPYVKVHSHDHVGSTWSSITFECVHWKLLLAAAVKMYPDGTVQLEIDFFRGCAERDEWQVGQIGFSDFNHSYFLIGMDICRSENNISAGRLLDRALEMLNEVDGDCDYVLVDGGPALNLAIDNANKSRATARVKIKKRACHTHMNRLPNTRGGGKRGGNGSLPRYLLDQGVDRKTMRKIVACIFMISWIPPSDEESFIVALELLIQKFGNSLNDHVRQKYLNGDRLSLGGHMAGKPGQVASTNGMERFGGWTKTEHSKLLEGLHGSKKESKNPYHLIHAAAKATKFHRSETVANSPNKLRKDFLFAFKVLKDGSNFTPASSLPANSNRRRVNFCSTFLYSFVTIDNGDGSSKSDFSLHEVIGNDQIVRSRTSFTWTAPSCSVIYTELSAMLMEQNESMISAPAQMQRAPSTCNTSTENLEDLQYLTVKLAEISPLKQKYLKGAISARMKNDTPAPQAGEDVVDYLYRRAQRIVSVDAMDTSHKQEVGSKRKGGKRSGGKSKKKNDMSIFEQRDEELRRDKECDNDDEAAVEETDAANVNKATDEEVFRDPDEVIEEVQPLVKKKRIRPNKELGDFTHTQVKSCGTITCTCGHFSFWRWCEHCVWIEVLHFQVYPTISSVTKASDQWHLIRSKFLQMMKETCIDKS